MTAEPGTELPTQTYTVTRADLVAYAAASGDQNPIHQDEQVARSVGLPGVIAHGMYTLALAARAADTWAGAPGRVVELGAKFTKPVVVPAGDEGVEVVVAGVVEEDRRRPDHGRHDRDLRRRQGARHADGGAAWLRPPRPPTLLLRDVTTLRVGGPADRVVTAASDDDSWRRSDVPTPTALRSW